MSLGRFARLNFSKSGVSLGLGPRGLNVNLGSKGVRTTVGLPGSGLSYQTFQSWRRRGRSASPTPPPAGPAARAAAPTCFPWRLVLSVAMATVLVLGGRTVQRAPSLPATPAPRPSAAAAVAPAPTAPACPAAPVAMDAAAIRDVQTLLMELGYPPGPIDGMTGPLTRKAIDDYLRARGLPGNDEPSPALLAHLRLDAAQKR
jgi:hypothetical protein